LPETDEGEDPPVDPEGTQLFHKVECECWPSWPLGVKESDARIEAGTLYGGEAIRA
jgi:hypothetical protein